MIMITKQIDDIFKALYKSEGISISQSYTYDQIIESNSSRLDYLNHLFEKIENNELSEECSNIFSENIDFIHNFMNGKYNRELTVPKKYFDDKELCFIVPQPEDLEYLFKLFEANKEMFEILYKNKRFMIELPRNSLNQNMKRILEIYEHNLAHLLGLTESEPTPNLNKNILKKYFMSNIENQEQYGDKISERLLNWILSDEGKNELRRLNRITIDFINEDKKNHPNNYDENGNIKPKSFENFKNRFKEANGFDFPIIKFSRYITKSINSLNFLNMNNIFQIILDYNAPEGKKDEKDIFLINSPIPLMSKEITNYIMLNRKVLEVITQYANNDKELKEGLQEILDEIGINLSDKDIISFVNIIQAHDFIGKHGINPNQTVALEKIRNIISEYFDRNIHLIGFDTEFAEGEIKINDFTTNYAHCDTSISLTAAELVGEYYYRGRPFFLDKIFDETGERLLRISNPEEEILYLNQMAFLEPDNLKQSQKLKNKLSTFQEKYIAYKNSLGNGKKK